MIAVAVAIYLVDCVVLLERGQALWSGARLAFGSLHYQVRGRVVALLNPLTPFVAPLRTRPLLSGAAGVEPEGAARALAPLGMLALLQLLLVLAALPYCLIQARGWPFFAALLAAYANAIALLGLLWWRLSRARLATRPLAALAFGWLACLPLSINALRRAALAFDAALDAPAAIDRLPDRERERARAALAAQIDEALLELDDADPRRARMEAILREIAPPARGQGLA